MNMNLISYKILKLALQRIIVKAPLQKREEFKEPPGAN